MFGNRFSASRRCSTWRHEPKPGRLDQSRACRFLKVATHPILQLRGMLAYVHSVEPLFMQRLCKKYGAEAIRRCRQWTTG